MAKYKMKYRRVIKDWCTEPDGESFDPMPVLAIIATVFILVLVGHNYFVRGGEFNISEFGIGLAAVWAASAGGSRLRPQARYNPQSNNYNNNYSPGSRRTEDLE